MGRSSTKKARRHVGTEARSESRDRPGRDGLLVRAICRWFGHAGRPLPWRLSPRDPYISLVSEFMLQQTQVSRVLEKFGPFMERFPDVESLAAAAEGDVLAAWSGMGYYRRARNLQAAAKAVVEDHDGRVPEEVAALRELPGVGRYTAGAIASIVFGRPEPIVDGNVARVLLRLEGKELDAPEGMAWAWGRAEQLVESVQKPGPAALNEGLMELGAMICTPRAPRCPTCPVRTHCAAFATGKQEDIPRPKARVMRLPMYCAAVVVEDAAGRVLVERRGDEGMWAGLWQAPTLESIVARPGRRTVEGWIGAAVRKVERFGHGTTHRDVSFDVWRAQSPVDRPGTVWRPRSQIAALGLSNPMRRILLGAAGGGGE